jgi:hypothetical protein
MLILDEETDERLDGLAAEDRRSRSAEVRFLIDQEWERRLIARTARGLRDTKERYHPGADADQECGVGSTPSGSAGTVEA